MNNNLLAIVNRITSERGEGILADLPHFNPLFDNYAKDEPEEDRNAFCHCLEAGAYQELKKIPTESERMGAKAALADQVHKKTGIDVQHCADALDLLEAVLFKSAIDMYMYSRMDKVRLQRMYVDVLTKAGYEPGIEENGDISFIYQDIWFSVEIYDDDINFGRLRFLIEAEFDDDSFISAFMAASEVSANCKLPKSYIRDDSNRSGKQFIAFAISFLLDHPGDFKKNLQRMLDELLDAYQEFHEAMKRMMADNEDDEDDEGEEGDE